MSEEHACNAGDTGDAGLIPGWEDLLEKEMAIHSSIFAWEINRIHFKIKGLKKSGETALKVSSVRNSKCHKSDFPGGSVVKNLPANAGDTDPTSGLGRSHMPWNNKVCAPQLLSQHSKAQEPQLPSTCAATTEVHVP